MATGSVQPLPPPPPAPPPPPSPSPPAYAYPPIIIVLTIVLLIFFFIGFFSIYFCRCLMQNILCTWHLRHSPAGTPVGGANPLSASAGLDLSIVQSFPIFTYSTVKDYRKEKYGLECAICLLEFQGSDMLRLLPMCCHVFHQECIDLWLESHKTCPVCRRNLNSPMQSPVKMSPINSVHARESDVAVEDSVSITIKEDENENGNENENRREGVERGRVSCSVNVGEEVKVDRFTRSHSTGHSIVRNREEEDRFTLRLPEHVKTRILRGHNSSKSWAPVGEYKDRGNRRDKIGLAEVSGGDNKV